ncbi:MAG: hypothetical protein OXN15_01445 [Chloroflexota bacterium]|nr:hypothetical protein [Chloroflexota bacterium]
MQETEDPEEDTYKVREVFKLLMSFPGEDPVLLEVLTNGKTVRLDASMKAHGCQDLYERLEGILGEGMVREHPIA